MKFSYTLNSLLSFFAFITILTMPADAQELPVPFVANFDDHDLSLFDLSDPEEIYPFSEGKLQIVLSSSGTRTAEVFPKGLELDDFVLRVELHRDPWNSWNFGTGLVARFNSGNGYFLSLREDRMTIYLIGAGSISSLAEQPIDFDFSQGEAVQLEFTGVGETLKGMLSSLQGTKLAEVETTHSQWKTGKVAFNNVTRGTTATFDNFKAYHPDNPPKEEPPQFPPPFTDDFDDGDIDGWESVLIDQVTVPWPVEDGRLAIQLSGFPFTADAKPLGVTLDDFVLKVDMDRNSWSSTNFGSGLIARFDSGNGYYASVRSNQLILYLISGGGLSVISSTPLSFSPDVNTPLSLMFSGLGEQLSVRVFSVDNDLLAAVEATDSQWTNGRLGVVNTTRDTIAYYDNFKAYHPSNPPEDDLANNVEITVKAEPEAGGSVSEGGAFEVNSQVTLIATPNEGYRFSGWSGEGITDEAEPSLILTATRSQVITANFIKVWKPIITSNLEEGGTVNMMACVDDGMRVTIEATAAEGFHFVRWEGEAIGDPSAAKTEVTITGNANIQAIFERTIEEGVSITVNPVLDNPQLSVSRNRSEGMTISWIGGGRLQQLDEDAGEMADVVSVSPFLTNERMGIFRVFDPWNGSRATEIYVPSSYDEWTPIPLVIALHGFAQDPDYIGEYLDLQKLADTKGFLLVQPHGLPSTFQGHLGWNDGVPVFNEPADDVGYLRGLILAIQRELNVDPKRIVFYGHSNGGSVAYRMARRHSDVVAGVASLEGLPLILANDPAASEPVNILHVHGTDPSDGPAIEGGPFALGGEIYSVEGLIREWGALAGHETLERDPDKTLDLQDNLPGMDTIVSRMTGGSSDIAVEYWEIDGSKHFEPDNHRDFSEEVIDWLLAHPKP